MVKTTTKELGNAYVRASSDLFDRHGHMSPRQFGFLFREEYGLHHRIERIGGEYHSWVEFPQDVDYTAFILRWT